LPDASTAGAAVTARTTNDIDDEYIYGELQGGVDSRHQIAEEGVI
jgi:hypothetical protein